MFREHEKKRVICEEIWRLPEETETEDIDGAEGYRTSCYLAIPKRLKECIQSVEELECGIKVVHRVEFSIELLKPAGTECTVSHPTVLGLTVITGSSSVIESHSTFTCLQRIHLAKTIP